MREIIIDERTGELHLKARDRRLYTIQEVEDAEARAATGDEAARALVESLDRGSDVLDVSTLLHDCPDCRAALARGEQPVIIGPAQLGQLRALVGPRPDRKTRRAAERAARRRK